MLSFELAGGVEEVRRFIANVRYFTLAESLGGVESLVAHPATMTHADMGEDARTIAGISDRLLRMSIGLEAAHDLIAGLECGLTACTASTGRKEDEVPTYAPIDEIFGLLLAVIGFSMAFRQGFDRRFLGRPPTTASSVA